MYTDRDSVLAHCFSFVDDGEDEGRRLIGIEGGGNNQVLGWF